MVVTFARQDCAYLFKLLNFRVDLRDNAFHFHTKSLTAVKRRLVLSNVSR